MKSVTAAHFDTSFASRLAKVDLSAIMADLQKEYGLSVHDTARAEEQYRQFLTLKSLYAGRTINPPKLADLVWHAHITSTRQYMADCEMLFGEYLHHTPSDEPTQSQVEMICGLFVQHFGVNPMLYGLDNVAYRGMAGCD